MAEKTYDIEDEEIVFETIDNAQNVLDYYNARWEEYQKAIKAIENASKSNPYIDNIIGPKQLENEAVEIRNKTGIDIITILWSVEIILRKGRRIEDIKKIIETAATMAKELVMPFNDAVECLHDSFLCRIGILGELYPEINDMPVEKLVSGGAADYINNKLNRSENGKVKKSGNCFCKH
jgi:hypothetical protein